MWNFLSFFVGLISFQIELFVGDLLFALHFRKKDHVVWRCLGAFGLELLLGLPICILCYGSDLWLIKNTLYYLLLFFVSLIMPFFCFREEPMTLVFCAVSGYLAQHIGSQCNQMLWAGQLASSVNLQGWGFPFYCGTQLVIYGAIYGLIYLLFAQKTSWISVSDQMDRKTERNLLRLSIATLLVVTILSSIRDTYADESFVLMAVSRCFSVFCCVLLLYLRSDIFEQSAMEEEHEALLRLHAQEKEQYEQSRENIELINVKCHDLRHQIEVWEHQGGRADPQELQRMKELIGIYDSAVKTGNETLDTILTERSLYCEKHGIRLSCIVDGSKLRFLSDGDICALFGNALENAIEAVSKLERPEDRNISFQVRENRGMLVITVDNYYAGTLRFDGPLPQTTKENGGYHGYGLKSIRMVAEKYGGEVTITADDGMFHLSVLLPIPAE